MQIDKVYIITLDDSEENKQSILGRLDKLTLPNRTTYHIINGVNGREELSTLKLRKAYGIKLYKKWSTASNDVGNKFYNKAKEYFKIKYLFV